MSAETPTAKCRCRHCNEHLEFDRGDVGRTINCPCCGLETQLYIPSLPAIKKQRDRTIIGILVLVVLIMAGVAIGPGSIGQAVGTGVMAVLAVCLAALVILVVVLWIAFPVFMYYGLARVEKHLTEVERNTRH